MPASAAATITTGYQVKFSKYPVLAFLVIMDPFNDIAAPSRKRIFLFGGDQAVEICQALIAQTVKKSIGQEGLCFITKHNLRTAAG